MEVLVLGDSDSSGAFSDGVSWLQLLEGSLTGGEPSAVRLVRFSPIPAGAAEFADGKVRELKPDVVIVLVGAYGFTFGFVELRVRRLLGQRAAKFSKRLESGFDARTKGRAGRPSRLNRLGRRIARAVIGTEPLTTREQLTANFKETFRTLARLEDTEVIAVTYPGIGHHANTGKVPQLRKAFFAELKEYAEAQHLTWVSLEGLFADLPDWRTYAIDELHFNPFGHERVAEQVRLALAGIGARV